MIDYRQYITELEAERETIEQAILAFRILATGQKRRGRPPAWLVTQKRLAPRAEASSNGASFSCDAHGKTFKSQQALRMHILRVHEKRGGRAAGAKA